MKKYILRLSLWLYGLLSLASCSIKEEIHFNKDLSGRMTYSIDLGGMMGMMQGMGNALDSTKEDTKLKPEMMTGLFDEVGTLEGISNFKSNATEGEISLSFDFKDLDALNRVYNRLSKSKNLDKLGGGGNFMPGLPPDGDSTQTSVETEPAVEDTKPQTPFVFFAREGKDLVFRRPKMDGESADMKNMDSQMEMLKGMGDMLKVETVFTFDRKIKKADAKDLEVVDKSDKSLKMRLSLQSLRKETQPEVRIRLK